MSNKWVIIGAVVMAFLVVRLVFLKKNRFEREQEWYVSNLRYDFSARIDSLIYENDTRGYFRCQLISGTLDYHVEDSLNRELKYYDHIRLLTFKRKKILRKSGILKKLSVGDSVYVNSDKDEFTIWRDGEKLFDWKVSEIMARSN